MPARPATLSIERGRGVGGSGQCQQKGCAALCPQHIPCKLGSALWTEGNVAFLLLGLFYCIGLEGPSITSTSCRVNVALSVQEAALRLPVTAC